MVAYTLPHTVDKWLVSCLLPTKPVTKVTGIFTGKYYGSITEAINLLALLSNHMNTQNL